MTGSESVSDESRGAVLITGGAGTIGIACARALAHHLIVLADVSQDRLDDPGVDG